MKNKRNPVAKHMNEFNKPRTYRDRKKQAKRDGDFREHPRHRPYKRERFDKDDYDLEEFYSGRRADHYTGTSGTLAG